jgi:hypothetical protein
VSATACMATGTYVAYHGSPGQPLEQQWDGTQWSPPMPTTAPTRSGDIFEGDLSGVSCRTQNFCIAVGSVDLGHGSTHGVHWSGTTWSTEPTPNPTGAGLTSVSCVRLRCIAVGSYTRVNAQHPLALTHP